MILKNLTVCTVNRLNKLMQTKNFNKINYKVITSYVLFLNPVKTIIAIIIISNHA